jgi:hypothetical protein
MAVAVLALYMGLKRPSLKPQKPPAARPIEVRYKWDVEPILGD